MLIFVSELELRLYYVSISYVLIRNTIIFFVHDFITWFLLKNSSFI